MASSAVAPRPSMDVIVMHEYGGPEVLQLRQAPVPEPGPGQVLIRVGSAAVNWSDTMRHRGDVYPVASPLPFTPGGEVAGTVEALGEGVSGPPIGTAVFALAGPDGSTGYAQFTVADAARVAPIPEGVTEGVTPLLMLSEAARLQPGQSVLVPAAAGGVGWYAVQLAKLLGAGTVIGLASTADKRKVALDLGADHVLDPAADDWPQRVRDLTGGRGVDIALEATGGHVLDRTLGVLAPFGRCVVYGYASRTPAALGVAATESLLYRPALGQALMGFNVGAYFGLAPQVAGPAIGQLVDWIATGRVRAPAIKEHPLADAAAAHRQLELRAVSGKIVLKPWRPEAQ